jgi:superfamily II DNA/RNA helicase
MLHNKQGDANSHPDLLKGSYGMGFKKPSKIQERALPLMLQNPYAITFIDCGV